MRTNGFALFKGRGGGASAAERVDRYCTARAFGSGTRFESWGDSAPGAGGCLIIACALGEDRGLPVVHGFVDLDGSGEHAMLGREGDTLIASRDTLGTRPLYVDQAGSIIASDHRFFRERPRLLPSGTRLETGSMKLTTSAIPTSGGTMSLDESVSELSRILREAVKKRIRGTRKVAVSFSGGLDSSLIALIAAEEVEVVLCSVYAAGSRDKEQAKASADSLGLQLVGVEIDRESAARELRALDLPFEPTPMDKALWCIYSRTASEAAGQGAELIMLGQLADELFGGYMKYARLARENEGAAAALMRADVADSGSRAFVRDEGACARFTQARFPFADEALVAFALGLPLDYKIAGGERKVVLREAASLLGLPEAIVYAPKKAAQYSSGVAKLVS